MPSSRIDDLRRRVAADPASIAFAQLAEEYRRAGQPAEAVAACRRGLARHPGYLSARVTLGRALTELGQFEEARRELTQVLAAVPDNRAALRSLGDACRRAGALEEARDWYRAALQLSPGDPELERAVADTTRVSAPEPGSPGAADRQKALATIRALEGWLEAIDAARADRRS